MDTVTLNYDRYNVQAQKALENILALGYFKLHNPEKRYKAPARLARKKDDDFLCFVSEQTLAKDWLNENEDEAWKNL